MSFHSHLGFDFLKNIELIWSVKLRKGSSAVIWVCFNSVINHVVVIISFVFDVDRSRHAPVSQYAIPPVLKTAYFIDAGPAFLLHGESLTIILPTGLMKTSVPYVEESLCIYHRNEFPLSSPFKGKRLSPLS